MKLKKLIQGIELEAKGSKEKEISGLCSDSRKTAPGHLFIAKRGQAFDGNLFTHQAVEHGAAAILAELYNPFLSGVTQLIHPHPERVEALLASRFYGEPSKGLFVFGVTGTNGKTTTTYLVKHLFDALERNCGLIGTVETIVGQKRHFSTLTTHDVVSNHKLLRDMVEENCKAACVEVSSHGLKQGRLDEIHFDAVLFTNLTPDHLDYHPDMVDYSTSKAKLFSMVENSSKRKKCAIVNGDDPMGKRMLEECPSVPKLTFGLSEGLDVRASKIRMSSFGTTFSVAYGQRSFEFKTSLIGRFNVYNVLGAVALGLFFGVDLEKMAEIFASFKTAPGRLERVQGAVFVDYAHTEDALRNVLSTLKELKAPKIIVVFGAGGNRDPGRRPGLARAAEEGADLVIVTSDNPRQEDPEEICRQILAGFKDRSKVRVELDRKRAIELAIANSDPEDLILIAGKGHERVQIFAKMQVPFDDRIVALEALAKACRI